METYRCSREAIYSHLLFRRQQPMLLFRANGDYPWLEFFQRRPSVACSVLVQPEMEKRRSPLVSIPPFGRGFSRHGVFRSDGGWGRKNELLRPVHRLDEPAGISLGMVASPQCPLPFRPAKSL